MMKLQFMATLVLWVAGLLFTTEPPPLALQTAGTSAHKSPISVGEMAPDFTLQDQQGRSVKMSAARRKTPVVLVFYRGYW